MKKCSRPNAIRASDSDSSGARRQPSVASAFELAFPIAQRGGTWAGLIAHYYTFVIPAVQPYAFRRLLKAGRTAVAVCRTARKLLLECRLLGL